jgi:hypothetical protein
VQTDLERGKHARASAVNKLKSTDNVHVNIIYQDTHLRARRFLKCQKQ